MICAHLFKRSLHTQLRPASAHSIRRFATGGLENILSGGPALPVQVRSLGPNGIQLADGLEIPSACIFLEGKVFLWNVPQTLWEGWTKEHFQIFDVVVPKPEVLLLGTGKSVVQLPLALRNHLSQIGVQVDVMDTWNACTTYNMLSEEGRRVAAALLPHTPSTWETVQTSQ